MPNRHLGGVNKEVSARKVVKQTDIEIRKYWAANDIHSHNLPPFDGSIGTAGKSGSSEKKYEVYFVCFIARLFRLKCSKVPNRQQRIVVLYFHFYMETIICYDEILQDSRQTFL